MSGDPLRLVKFMCGAKGHSTARSDSALTIHEGVWAFCYAGGQTPGHEWKAVDGLPLNDAMRFAQLAPAARMKHATPAVAAPAAKTRRTVTAAPKDGAGSTR